MDYTMEELLPIVAKLANKYTGGESTSITYERAEQLMEAVLYCIREGNTGHKDYLPVGKRVSAQSAYTHGLELVRQKVKSALDLYHEILQDFHAYGNTCLYETFALGMPEFFKWYDIYFDPQNTILTLDYPILEDLASCSGVDKIYRYLSCIRLEQRFLRSFPENYVVAALRRYDERYESMIVNICEMLLLDIIRHISEKNQQEEVLCQKICAGDIDLQQYLVTAIRDILTRLRLDIP